MLSFAKAVVCSVLLASYAMAAPAAVASSASASTDSPTSSTVSMASSSSASGTGTSSAADATSTVPYASDDPNGVQWNETSTATPQAERGTLGSTILGPHNVPLELQNPDLLAPPTTDSGSV